MVMKINAWRDRDYFSNIFMEIEKEHLKRMLDSGEATTTNVRLWIWRNWKWYCYWVWYWYGLVTIMVVLKFNTFWNTLLFHLRYLEYLNIWRCWDQILPKYGISITWELVGMIFRSPWERGDGMGMGMENLFPRHLQFSIMKYFRVIFS